MQYKTVIIGLGTIAHYHVAGLRQSERFDLCAVCDLREEAAKDALWCDLPFYRDYGQMLDAVRPDVAIIATPPAAHYEIAKACVSRGILPFVEKPLAATKRESKLFFSKTMRGQFVPVCHTLYGSEMIWFLEHMPLHVISSITTIMMDPYVDAVGHIAPQYYPLCGSWLDSAPNALAPILRLIPRLEDVRMLYRIDETCGLPYTSHMAARYEKTKVEVTTIWHPGINLKQTEIEADGKRIVLNQSMQEVEVDGEIVFRAEGDRLTNQYANFYRLYPDLVPDEQMLKEMYRIIWIND